MFYMDINEIKRNFSTNIAKLRKSKGWSQSQFGEYIHYSFKAISKWENGDCLPDVDVMSDIAEKFNLTIDELISTKNVVALSHKTRNRIFITATSSFLPYLFGTITFLVLYFCKVPMSYIAFPGAALASGIVMLVLSRIWFTKPVTFIGASMIPAMTSLILMIVFNFRHFWTLLIAAAVAEVLLLLFFFIEIPSQNKNLKR